MDVTYARLNVTTKRLGNDPRCGFYASSSLSHFEEQTGLINEQIVAVVASTNILSLIFDVRHGGKASHRLFEVYSRDDDRLYANCPIRHVSDWSLMELLEKYQERQTDIVPLLNLIQNEPTLSSIDAATSSCVGVS
jgi:hypothetical protein